MHGHFGLAIKSSCGNLLRSFRGLDREIGLLIISGNIFCLHTVQCQTL